MIYPGASVRLIDKAYISGARLDDPQRVNLHTQAGNGSLYGYFNRSGAASSHFWVSKGGLVEQYVDTALRAEADLDGNATTISVETEGVSEPWTPAQVSAIIALVSWALDTHGIPLALATSSQPGVSSQGVSWHRLGIDGNFPALPSRYAGRQQRGGGTLYSNSFGKACPTEARIDQIFDEVWPAVCGDVVPKHTVRNATMWIVSSPNWGQVGITDVGGAASLDDATAGVLREGGIVPAYDYDRDDKVQTQISEAWKRADQMRGQYTADIVGEIEDLFGASTVTLTEDIRAFLREALATYRSHHHGQHHREDADA